MKIQSTPPGIGEILSALDPERLQKIFKANAGSLDSNGRYLHWDELKRKISPNDLSAEEWWAATKLAQHGSHLLLVAGVERFDLQVG